MRPNSYVLRNISRYDLNLSDLGVRIPLGQSRDLLDPKLNLAWEDIIKSKTKGSIYLRMRKGMVEEINKIVSSPVPLTRAQVIREMTVVKFPDRLLLTLGVLPKTLKRCLLMRMMNC